MGRTYQRGVEFANGAGVRGGGKWAEGKRLCIISTVTSSGRSRIAGGWLSKVDVALDQFHVQNRHFLHDSQ